MIYTVCRYFFWFILYSVLGWIVETLLYILRDRKVVKRGFLFGPLCPIYGTSAILCNWALYGRIHNVFLIFIAGFFLCGVLEYLTHFLMEKLFDAMWWDYSDRKFNIHGRVYLKGLLFFGVGIVLLICVVHPLVVELTDWLPPTALYWICFVLYSILIADTATTVADLKGSINALKRAQAAALSNTQEGIDRTGEQLEQLKETIKNSEIYMKTLRTWSEHNFTLRRIKHSYPDFKIKKARLLLDLLLDPPQEGKRASDKKLYGTADSLPHADDDQPGPEDAPEPDKLDKSES